LIAANWDFGNNVSDYHSAMLEQDDSQAKHGAAGFARSRTNSESDRQEDMAADAAGLRYMHRPDHPAFGIG